MNLPSSNLAQTPSPWPGQRGMSVDLADTIESGIADLCLFVLPDACAVQHQVAGQWIDVCPRHTGGILLTELSGPLRVDGICLSRALALRITNTTMGNHFGDIVERVRASRVIQLKADKVVDSLARVLVMAGEMAAPCVEEPVTKALALRLSVLLNRGSIEQTSKGLTLPSWRLRRVADFVRDCLASAISLADMAAAAGLSPMHFAAQFKAATGMRPHHFLLAQRIERAKELLEQTDDSILDIAIAVGFQAQTHFATVFKHHESVTPRQWRGERGKRPHSAQRAVHRARASAQHRRSDQVGSSRLSV